MFGKIKHKTEKGYAFIRPQRADNAPLQDYFLYHAEFLGDWNDLQTGDLVEFTPGLRRGNPIAIEVRLLAEPAEEVSGASNEQQ